MDLFDYMKQKKQESESYRQGEAAVSRDQGG